MSVNSVGTMAQRRSRTRCCPLSILSYYRCRAVVGHNGDPNFTCTPKTPQWANELPRQRLIELGGGTQ